MNSRCATALLLPLLAAGCANLQWQKPGADPAVLKHDLSECQDSARLRARNEAPLFGQPAPFPIGVDTRGRVVSGRAGYYETERALMENDFTRHCMGERGYKLAPAEQP